MVKKKVVRSKKKTAVKKKKKTPTKKKVLGKKKKKLKPKLLRKVKPEFSFVVINGKKIRGLPELALEIEFMEDHVFCHHVNENKNDFANWVREVIGEIELADKLMGINKKEDTQLQILKHIVKSLK